jgi:Prokaryotic membrane lipoprotein lipid attachment site
MKRTILCTATAVVVLAGCNRPVGASSGSEAHGRYASAGIYPAGRMWSQIASVTAPKEAATAKLGDDEQIIVVLDSQTGELRQCGNISGYCVGMNPWAKSVPATAPLAVAKHADQLDAESKAQLDAAEAKAKSGG